MKVILKNVIVIDVREENQRAEGGLKGWAKEGYLIKTGLGVTLLTKEG